MAGGRKRARSFPLALALIAAALVPPSAGAERALGDSAVVARVPAPGFPEGIAVNDGLVWVSGPAQFGHRGESKLWAFDIDDGTLVREITVQAMTPGYHDEDHGISGIAFDAEDRLYLLDVQQGMLRFLPDGTQERYTDPFPNLPPCLSGASPCSPTLGDAPPLPNDMVFDDDGTAYVSDSLQATIWRIPPGGGTPQIWFQDARLETPPVGTNGVRIRDGLLYVAVTGNALVPGRIYTLPLIEGPAAGDLTVFHEWATEGPDGFVFGASGAMYVALALASRIAVLDEQGNEIAVYAGPARDGEGTMPWDMPANLAFDDAERRLLVVNHALVLGLLLPERFVVFDLYVDDTADGPARPSIG